MTPSLHPKYILAVESAVADGSIALLCPEFSRIIKRDGSGCSRAEKIISLIADVIAEAGIAAGDLDLIVVSTGPGSYSGIRIGVSTVLGLANALGIPCKGVSVLEAMAHALPFYDPFIAAIPVGKNDVAWQQFDPLESGAVRPARPPELSSWASFLDRLKSLPGIALFSHATLLARVSDKIPESTPCTDAGTFMAEFLGRFALTGSGTHDSLQPIYLRNKDVQATVF